MPTHSSLLQPRAIGLMMCASLVVMANATISPALPGLATKFAGQPNADLLVRLLVPAPSLAALFVAPIAGGLSDRLGRGAMLITASIVFLCAGAAGAFLDDIYWLMVSRLTLGAALAMIVSTQTALIGDFFEGPERDAFVGHQVSARNFAGLLYVVLAGFLANWSAEWAFGVYLLTALYLPFIFAAARAASQYKSPKQNAQATEATQNWATPVVTLCGLLLLITLVFFIMPTQLPFFLSAQGQDEPVITSLAMAGIMIAGGAAASQYGRMQRVTSATVILALGFLGFALGFAALSTKLLPFIGLGCAIVGGSYSVLISAASNLVLIAAPPDRRGLASGMGNSAVFLGAVLSPLITTPMIQHLDFSATYIAAAVLSAVAALLATLSALVSPLKKDAT